MKCIIANNKKCSNKLEWKCNKINTHPLHQVRVIVLVIVVIVIEIIIIERISNTMLTWKNKLMLKPRN